VLFVKVRLFLYATVSLSCTLTAIRASAVTVEVQGRLTYTINRFQKAPLVIEKDFRVVTDACVARIRTQPHGSQHAWIETSIDGHTIHSVAEYYSLESKVTNYSGVVEYRDVPRDDSSNISYLWLAYGSSCYLKARPSGSLRPVWTLDDPALQEEGFLLPASWDVLQTNGLPRKIIYWGDGHWHVVTQQGRQTIPMPTPFDVGFTNAELSVVSNTNIGELSIPTDLVFTRYGVQNSLSQPGTYEAKVVTTTHVVATNVMEVREAPSVPPRFAGILMATDRRFFDLASGVKRITYSVTNGEWPNITYLSKIFAMEKRATQTSPSASPPRKPGTPSFLPFVIGIAIFAAIVLVPIVVFISLRRRGPK